MTAQNDDGYWRDIVAAAAEVKSAAIMQGGFAEALKPEAEHMWYYVAVGPLVLCHDGMWVFPERGEGVPARMRYAHASAKSAISALREKIAPSTSWHADLMARICKVET